MILVFKIKKYLKSLHIWKDVMLELGMKINIQKTEMIVVSKEEETLYIIKDEQRSHD